MRYSEEFWEWLLDEECPRIKRYEKLARRFARPFSYKLKFPKRWGWYYYNYTDLETYLTYQKVNLRWLFNFWFEKNDQQRGQWVLRSKIARDTDINNWPIDIDAPRQAMAMYFLGRLRGGWYKKHRKNYLIFHEDFPGLVKSNFSGIGLFFRLFGVDYLSKSQRFGKRLEFTKADSTHSIEQIFADARQYSSSEYSSDNMRLSSALTFKNLRNFGFIGLPPKALNFGDRVMRMSRRNSQNFSPLITKHKNFGVPTNFSSISRALASLTQNDIGGRELLKSFVSQISFADLPVSPFAPRFSMKDEHFDINGTSSLFLQGYCVEHDDYKRKFMQCAVKAQLLVLAPYITVTSQFNAFSLLRVNYSKKSRFPLIFNLLRTEFNGSFYLLHAVPSCAHQFYKIYPYLTTFNRAGIASHFNGDGLTALKYFNLFCRIKTANIRPFKSFASTFFRVERLLFSVFLAQNLIADVGGVATTPFDFFVSKTNFISFARRFKFAQQRRRNGELYERYFRRRQLLSENWLKVGAKMFNDSAWMLTFLVAENNYFFNLDLLDFVELSRAKLLFYLRRYLFDYTLYNRKLKMYVESLGSKQEGLFGAYFLDFPYSDQFFTLESFYQKSSLATILELSDNLKKGSFFWRVAEKESLLAVNAGVTASVRMGLSRAHANFFFFHTSNERTQAQSFFRHAVNPLHNYDLRGFNRNKTGLTGIGGVPIIDTLFFEKLSTSWLKGGINSISNLNNSRKFLNTPPANWFDVSRFFMVDNLSDSSFFNVFDNELRAWGEFEFTKLQTDSLVNFYSAFAHFFVDDTLDAYLLDRFVSNLRRDKRVILNRSVTLHRWEFRRQEWLHRCEKELYTF
jgi:hypothetical protein